jgi:hypothetical protein
MEQIPVGNKAQGAEKGFAGESVFLGKANLSLLSARPTISIYPTGLLKAQGIVPGRVSWVGDPKSTNPDCANKP